MELAKSIIELISSGLVLVGIIWGTWKAKAFFSYKYDAEIRSMYIKNCNNVREIMGRIISRGEAKESDIKAIRQPLQDAYLFLHQDIIKFLQKVYKVTVDMWENSLTLETFNEPTQTQKQQIELHDKLMLEMKSLNKQSYKLYRKHIVNDGFNASKFEELLNYNAKK